MFDLGGQFLGWLGSSAAHPPGFSHWGLPSVDPSHPSKQIRTTSCLT
jgi:hypothetical protein